MRKQALILFFVALVLGMVPAAMAQTGTVKGYVKDKGTPIVGAQVLFENLDNGRKMTLKTDKAGNFFSIGVAIGSYKITITADGKTIWNTAKYPVGGGDGNPELNIDLEKERAAQATANPANAEAVKKAEENKKENEKIGNLNTMLKEAQADMQAKNFDAAIQIMEKATAQDATHDIIWAVLADAYLGAKRYPDAVKAYEKAIALDPSKAPVHNNYAQALAKTGQSDKAIAEYDAAAKLDPAHAGSFYFNEGAVLTNAGKTDDANAAFDKAIAADPTKADAYYQKGVNLMGKATQKDGKYVAAPGTVEAFNKYLELSPDGPNAQNAKDMIAALGGTVVTGYKAEKGKKSK
ncbi:Tetratricopeptide repeat protein [Candidatus Koribacter versatilis Ellin345]|uniref:Tetratricopeptide repeat protein n=1 Tax=Koribacter versatilis (strain Ellin345) TaxID=204669 RepID=Q1IHK5_KORVE|nr:tetratricopeptide repeat protein [Candidatus Koribacter versatilis]ABF43645.1 Tetratricopeptide repeat protein [Candidatus Koribacter versatilis Ellin345]